MERMQDITITCVDKKEGLLAIKKDVQGLFRTVFGRELSDKVWEHFYLNGPYGCGHSFVCYKDSALIAHGGVYPHRLVDRSGKEYACYHQLGIMVDQRHRDRSVFTALMDTMHRFFIDNGTFTWAFPNEVSYLPFVRMLGWRMVAEYNIGRYVAGDTLPAPSGWRTPERGRYGLFLKMDETFLKWRGELNNMKILDAGNARVIYKEYEGAMEILDVEGNGISFRDIMKAAGYDSINIPDCFFGSGEMEGLRYVKNTGIPQRLCVYPPESKKVDHNGIKPSLLLSDVF